MTDQPTVERCITTTGLKSLYRGVGVVYSTPGWQSPQYRAVKACTAILRESRTIRPRIKQAEKDKDFEAFLAQQIQRNAKELEFIKALIEAFNVMNWGTDEVEKEHKKLAAEVYARLALEQLHLERSTSEAEVMMFETEDESWRTAYVRSQKHVTALVERDITEELGATEPSEEHMGSSYEVTPTELGKSRLEEANAVFMAATPMQYFEQGQWVTNTDQRWCHLTEAWWSKSSVRRVQIVKSEYRLANLQNILGHADVCQTYDTIFSAANGLHVLKEVMRSWDYTDCQVVPDGKTPGKFTLQYLPDAFRQEDWNRWQNTLVNDEKTFEWSHLERTVLEFWDARKDRPARVLLLLKYAVGMFRTMNIHQWMARREGVGFITMLRNQGKLWHGLGDHLNRPTLRFLAALYGEISDEDLDQLVPLGNGQPSTRHSGKASRSDILAAYFIRVRDLDLENAALAGEGHNDDEDGNGDEGTAMQTEPTGDASHEEKDGAEPPLDPPQDDPQVGSAGQKRKGSTTDDNRPTKKVRFDTNTDNTDNTDIEPAVPPSSPQPTTTAERTDIHLPETGTPFRYPDGTTNRPALRLWKHGKIVKLG